MTDPAMHVVITPAGARLVVPVDRERQLVAWRPVHDHRGLDAFLPPDDFLPPVALFDELHEGIGRQPGRDAAKTADAARRDRDARPAS